MTQNEVGARLGSLDSFPLAQAPGRGMESVGGIAHDELRIRMEMMEMVLRTGVHAEDAAKQALISLAILRGAGPELPGGSADKAPANQLQSAA